MQAPGTTIHPSGNVSYHPSGNPPPYDAPPGSYGHGPPGPPGPYGPPYITHQPVIQTMVPGTIITQRVVGSQPSSVVCQSCNMEIVTRVEFKPSLRTHLMALIFCVLGCWPCVCVPYCVESCNNVDHYCPNCSAYVGSFMN